MVGRDVEQHRDIAIQALRQIDLIARELEHIDAGPAPVWNESVLREDWKSNIAAHHRWHGSGLEHVMDQRGRGRLAVGAGDPDDLVPRQLGPGTPEHFDVADNHDIRLARTPGNRVSIEWDSRSDHKAVEPRKIRLVEILDTDSRRKLL